MGLIPSISLATPATDKQLYIDSKSQELLNEGLTSEDAMYYAKLDYMVKNLDKNGQEVIVDKSIPDMTDAQVKSDIKAFRKKVLSGDKQALKKALQSTARIYQDGIKRMETLIKENPGQAQYILEYPDGSKIIYSPGTVHQVTNDNFVHPSDYEEAYVSTTYLTTGNWILQNYNWQLTSGASYARISLIRTDHTVNTSTRYHAITYGLSGSNSAGVVSAATSTAVISRPTNNNQTGTPAEVYAQCLMTVSGSFSASYLGVSVGVIYGQSWTQYLFTRGYGDGVTGHYIAVFDNDSTFAP